MLNKNTENFRQNLVNIINQCGLPPALIYYVLKDVYKEVEKTYFNLVENQGQQLKNDLTEKESSIVAEK